MNSLSDDKETVTSAAEEVRSDWPRLVGDYTVGDCDASVAICTLSSRFVYDKISGAPLLHRVALVGVLETENIGIEKLVKNTIANPAIRFIIVCGKEPRGHQAGQALLALQGNGVDQHGRIQDAAGARPVVANLTPDEIGRFQQQVHCVDLRGEESLAAISQAVQECLDQSLAPLARPAVEVSRSIPTIQAEAAGKRPLAQDPAGFFIIFVRDGLLVERYDAAGLLQQRIVGQSAKAVMDTLLRKQWVTRVDHAAYLGRELQKAQHCWRSGLRYVQDQDAK